MAFCSSCGAPLAEGQNFCSSCGKAVSQPNPQPNPQPNSQPNSQPNAQSAVPGVDLSATVKNMIKMSDETSKYDAADIEDSKIIAILSYLSLLVLIPLFAVKNSPFVRFHANQGLVLCLVSLVTSFVGYLLGLIPFAGMVFGFLFGLIDLGFLALAILGIINCVKGKAKRLPLIGSIILIK